MRCGGDLPSLTRIHGLSIQTIFLSPGPIVLRNDGQRIRVRMVAP